LVGVPVVLAALVDFLAGAFAAFFAAGCRAAGWAADFCADFLAGAFVALRAVFCGAAARATSGTGSAAPADAVPERVPDRVLRLAGGMSAVWHADDHHGAEKWTTAM
jgi:hypothetical protein